MPDQIFDDYNHVNCLDCHHYWNDTCDGPPTGLERPCTAFLATKRVDIPAQIKELQNGLKVVLYGSIALTACFLIYVTVDMLFLWGIL